VAAERSSKNLCQIHYDEHMPESSIEILGHSVGGIIYRYDASADHKADWNGRQNVQRSSTWAETWEGVEGWGVP
jgi:triacylglycerol esterase/lipase EstA (alpha/beta hydrolase family)